MFATAVANNNSTFVNNNNMMACRKISSAKKNIYTPAKALKKVFKSLKKLFVHRTNNTIAEVPIFLTCQTEEEHQNYLNELLESQEEAEF